MAQIKKSKLRVKDEISQLGKVDGFYLRPFSDQSQFRRAVSH
jgi:hypothetical protein